MMKTQQSLYTNFLDLEKSISKDWHKICIPSQWTNPSTPPPQVQSPMFKCMLGEGNSGIGYTEPSLPYTVKNAVCASIKHSRYFKIERTVSLQSTPVLQICIYTWFDLVETASGREET